MNIIQPRKTEQPATQLTGAEWARQEHLAMLGASIQARTTQPATVNEFED